MDNDQGEGQEAEAPETEEKPSEEGKPEASDTEQSSEKEETKEEKLYEDSLTGKNLTADQLYETYKTSQGHTTRISQELAELKKAHKTSEASAEDSIRGNKLLKDVSPDVQEMIIEIVKPYIAKENQKKEQEIAQKSKDKALDDEFSSLEKKHDGKDGLPKFNRKEVIAKMVEKGNRIYDPLTIYHKLHEKEVNDYLIKKALKQQRGGRQSEETGKSDSSKPTGKTPSTFAEASHSMLSRLKSSE